MTHELNQDPFRVDSVNTTRNPSRFNPDQSTLSSTQPQQRMRARVHGSAATQSLTSNTPTDIVFDVVDFDTAGLLTANQFKIPTTGKVTGVWLFHAHVTFVPGAAGNREATILANGVIIANDILDAGGADDTSVDVQILVNDPSPGTLFKVQATQVSGGGALNLDKDPTKTYFEVVHLW